MLHRPTKNPAVLGWLLRVAAVRADDVILARPIAELKIVEGSLPPGALTRPASDAPPFPWGQGQFAQVPYAVPTSRVRPISTRPSPRTRPLDRGG